MTWRGAFNDVDQRRPAPGARCSGKLRRGAGAAGVAGGRGVRLVAGEVEVLERGDGGELVREDAEAVVAHVERTKPAHQARRSPKRSRSARGPTLAAPPDLRAAPARPSGRCARVGSPPTCSQ